MNPRGVIAGPRNPDAVETVVFCKSRPPWPRFAERLFEWANLDSRSTRAVISKRDASTSAPPATIASQRFGYRLVAHESTVIAGALRSLETNFFL
jgi:hypothetical protein